MGYLGRLLGRTRTLDSHASRLRRKLSRSPETAYILNVWEVGYRLVDGRLTRERPRSRGLGPERLPSS
jgi:hypothetical protein